MGKKKKKPKSGPCSSVSGSASERCVSTWAMGSASREAPDGPLQAPISALCSLGRSCSGWERSAGWLWAIPASRRWMGRGKGSLGLGVPARPGAPCIAGLQQSSSRWILFFFPVLAETCRVVCSDVPEGLGDLGGYLGRKGAVLAPGFRVCVPVWREVFLRLLPCPGEAGRVGF